ncbi:MAG TPA: tetratricopeptide repeat protein [Steroidobacteraceae bacterium]|nr:tetratricopeptide repeat protein [Steroidobacteraceae bacterium]
MTGRIVVMRGLALGILAAMLVGLTGCGGAVARKSAHMEKGRQYLAAQNYEKARVEFQNALQIDPKSAPAYYEVGVAEEKLGHLPRAAQAYENAVELTPQHDYLQAAIALAKLMALNGAPQRATELLKTAVQQHPDDAELLAVRAVARKQLKDLAGAAADAHRAVELAPRNEDAIATLAGIYQAQGERDQARALVEGAVRDIPGSVDLRFMLAQIYTASGRAADAETQYRKLIELQPANPAHRLRLAEFYSNSNQLDAAEATLRSAVRDFPDDRTARLSLIEFLDARRGREVAEAELGKMIAAEPKNYDLQFALARIYHGAGDNQKAEAVYRGVIGQEGTDPPGLVARDGLAALRLQQNDPDSVLRLANEVLAQNPRDNDALIMRADVELARKDARDAIADLRTVQRDQPANPGVLRALARAHLANGEPRVAEEVMRQAVELNPGDATLESELAELLASLGKSDEANTTIARAVEQLPGNLQALGTQFRLAMASGDLHDAKAAADAIVAHAPKLAQGYMCQGQVAEAEKHYDDAFRLYSTAASLRPDALEPFAAVVHVLSVSSRLPEALKRLDEAAQKHPQDAMPLDLKGELLIENGRFADAEQAFRLAIARAPAWWPAYRGLVKAQLLAREDPATVIDGLRRAKAVVNPSERLSEVLASVLVRAGKPGEAIAEYEEALHKYPHSDLAANNLAMLLVTYRSDAASLDRARDLTARFADSPNADYRDTYGWVLYKRGEAAAAVPVFARIVAESPDAAVARYHLGMAQALAGNRADARDNLTRAVDSGKHFPGFAEAKSALEELNGGTPAPKS